MVKHEEGKEYIAYMEYNPEIKEDNILSNIDEVIKASGVFKYEILSKETAPVEGSESLIAFQVRYRVLEMK